MSKEQENKAVVGRWFKEFWGNPWNPKVVDNLAGRTSCCSIHYTRRAAVETT